MHYLKASVVAFFNCLVECSNFFLHLHCMVIIGYVDYNYILCAVTADCPTVLECTRFPGRQRTINIPQEIGSNYYYEYRKNAERINTEIIREWATGRGKKPVTWKTLTTVLRAIELGALASEIEVIKVKPTMLTTL